MDKYSNNPSSCNFAGLEIGKEGLQFSSPVSKVLGLVHLHKLPINVLLPLHYRHLTSPKRFLQILQK